MSDKQFSEKYIKNLKEQLSTTEGRNEILENLKYNLIQDFQRAFIRSDNLSREEDVLNYFSEIYGTDNQLIDTTSTSWSNNSSNFEVSTTSNTTDYTTDYISAINYQLFSIEHLRRQFSNIDFSFLDRTMDEIEFLLKFLTNSEKDKKNKEKFSNKTKFDLMEF